MQNNIENNFEELLRKKLAKHSLPVNDALWQGVQAKMATKKRIAFPVWMRYSAAAVAVLVAVSLLFVDLPQNKQIAQETLPNKATEILVDTALIGDDNDLNKSDEQTIKTNTVKEKALAQQSASKPKAQFAQKATAKTNIATAKTNVNAFENNELKKQIHTSQTNNALKAENTDNIYIAESKEQKTDVNTSPEKAIQSDDSRLLKSKNAELVDAPKSWDDPKSKKRKSRGWFIAANVSTGATSANVGGGMKTYAAESSVVKAPAAASNYVLSPSDFNSKSFAAPLSAGLSLARALSDVLSIETGVSYSQLNTKLSDRGLNADLNLHYVGVPVTLLANVVQISKFKVYASGGAMVEKGVYSTYSQEQVRGSQRINTTVNDRVDGLQYSLNAAVGAAYAVDKNIEFYFEPRYSFYFDNNQPISIRTNNGAVVGLHAGIRFEIQ